MDAAAWIERHLAAPPTGVEVVSDTPRSNVARLTTPAGTFYFKCDRILPPPEAAVLEHLAARWPTRVAPVVAIDVERGWTLTRAAGTPSLEEEGTDLWCRVVTHFAEIQLDSGLGADDWCAIGCRDFRGERLLAAIDAMLAAARSQLEEQTWCRLAALRPKVQEACDDLAADGIPATLVHQDLVPCNVLLRDDEPVFLDWSDTVVGHPFFGCDRLLDSCWSEPDRKAAVIDAYVGAFAGLAPPERLHASFQRVLWLRVLYEGVRWHHELAAIDPDSEHAVLLRRDLLAGLTLVATHQG